MLGRLLPWLVFAQGMLLTVAVATKWRHPANRHLAAFLLLLSLHGLLGLAWDDPTGRTAALGSSILSFLPYLYGPLVYRYVWHSLLRDISDPVPFAVHALPALVNLLLYAGIYFAVGTNSFAEIAHEVFSGRAPGYVILVEWGKVVHGAVYTALIVRLIVKHGTAIRRWAAREQRRRWLRSLVAAFAANWLLVLIGIVIVWNDRVPESVSFVVTTVQLVAFLAFLYMISFFALRYPAVLDPRDARAAIRAKLNLSEEFVDETLRRLRRAEAQKFYTDSEVTLTSLAGDLGLHPNTLSFVVNEEENQGFREYLNRLRLEEFLRMAGTYPNRSSLDLAFDAGFASKSTFLRAFKARYGTSPGDYLRRREQSQ